MDADRLALLDAAGHLQFRHGRGGKQPPAWLCDPSGQSRRPIDTGTVGGNTGVGVHLPVELGEQDKGQT